jgi:hypothetical protein
MRSMQKLLGLLIALSINSRAATVPTPREHFGFTPGDDYKLADYSQITSYFEKLSHASQRLRWVKFGDTSAGQPMYVAFISSPENLKKLDEYQDINRKLALAQVSDAEAKDLAQKGRVFVWIDSGLHATEVAPSQQAPELAYRMLTDESAEAQLIRSKVILMQVPCINPDGLDMVVEWYRSNLGTPYELAPLPQLYQKYAGHDNNRDWFMLNLPETRNVTKLLFQDWFPEIVYNQHQAPPFPARIFVPPYAEPLNPNIPASVMEGINQIGAAIKDRFALENKPGALSYFGFDAWWNGGLRSVPAFHNMHGILTETAGNGYATPVMYKDADIRDRFENGVLTKTPSMFYEKPWLGGRWRLRDAVDYMLTVDFAILNLAAERSSDYLYKAYQSAEAQIKLGQTSKPFGYAIPPQQWDATATREMLIRLKLAGVEIRKASARFSTAGREFPEGTFIIPSAQPFRGYAVDLLEPQKYPELRDGANGPLKRPYDIAGWTLFMQMGVDVVRLDEPLPAKLNPVVELNPAATSRAHNDSSFFQTMAGLLKAGKPLRWTSDGKLLIDGEVPTAEISSAPYTIRSPRVAVYDSWLANIDAGWTDWLLDQERVPHAMLRNVDLQKGNLNARFDSIILPAQDAAAILHGAREGERPVSAHLDGAPNALQRPEYTGGIEIKGLLELEKFVRQGGWLITFDQAGDVPVLSFPLPIRLLVKSGADEDAAPSKAYFCPGSILRVGVDTKNPIAFGMPPDGYVFSSGGQAYENLLLPEFNKGEREVRVVARYAAANVLASGFLSGESTVAGRPLLVDVRYGKGHVVLFGFRPQFRGQTYGTFRLVLNSIYLASAQVSAAPPISAVNQRAPLGLAGMHSVRPREPK